MNYIFVYSYLFIRACLIIRCPKVISFSVQFLQLMASAFVLAKVLPSNIAWKITSKKKDKRNPYTTRKIFFKTRKAETMADYVFVKSKQIEFYYSVFLGNYYHYYNCCRLVYPPSPPPNTWCFLLLLQRIFKPNIFLIDRFYSSLFVFISQVVVINLIL